MIIRQRLPQYFYLIRFHKPIGTLLLLWPTLWAMWIASQGHPDGKLLAVFILGVFLMRAAGCIMSDIFDRRFDAQVRRTRERPLASGKISMIEAIILLILLAISAFALVYINCNQLTIQFAMIGAALTIFYPLLKRITHLPQLGLGVAFSWGVPMAFAATTESVSCDGFILFLTCVIWPVIYDTFYAMVDREDDSKIGVKSTAILFGRSELLMIASLQLLFLLMLIVVGCIFQLKRIYYQSLLLVLFLFLYQLYLAKDRNQEQCLKAFINNHWVGLIIFMGIYLNYL